MKQFIKPLLRFIISFGAIGIILYLFREQLPEVIKNLQGADPVFFLSAVALFLVGLITTSMRLRLVLKVHDAGLPVPQLYYMNLVALFFNNVLPSHMGGEMVKAYYIYRGTNNNVASFSAVVVDRLFGLVAMVGIGVSAILIFDRGIASPKILSSVGALAIITVIVAIIIFNKKIVNTLCSLHVPFIPLLFIEKLREIYQAMHHYRGQRYLVIRCMTLTILGQVSFVIVNFLLAKCLAMSIPLGFFFTFVPIIIITGMAPSVNGIGVREAIYLFYMAGLTTPDKALALSLITSFFLVFVGIIGGIIYAFKGGLPTLKEMDKQDRTLKE